MSYPLDLDEFPTNKLQQELAHRIHRTTSGQCPYCDTNFETHTCRFAGRLHEYHPMAVQKETGIWKRTGRTS